MDPSFCREAPSVSTPSNRSVSSVPAAASRSAEMFRLTQHYGVAASLVISLWSATVTAQSPARWLQGMWSNPPDTIVGGLCGGACSQAAIDALNALVDDPANDRVPYAQLRTTALD